VSPKKELTPQFFPDRQSQRTQVQYGPFEVQGMNNEDGMIDYLQLNATMPCTNCTITFIQASLQYPNGTYANANTSLWLHHIVLINILLPDTVCGSNYYGKGQRWFASGNERTPADLCKSGAIPAGYYIEDGDLNIMLVELMNQEMNNQSAIATIDYEWIPGFPSDFYKIKPVWLDISGCDIASDMPAKSNTTFEYVMDPPYKADFNGVVVSMGGHVHDGGTHIDILKNGTVACDSVASYGQSDGYYDAAGAMNMPGMPKGVVMTHISNITGCYAPTLSGLMTVGDAWSNHAYYNFTAHTPMRNNDGSLSDVMGISIMYVAENMTLDQEIKLVGTPVAQVVPTATDGSMPMGTGADMGLTPMAMVCSAANSPGDLSAAGLDLSNDTVAMDYLMKILDDTCLQVWSNVYAEDYWYGILVVIGLFNLSAIFYYYKLVTRYASLLPFTNEV
jgi:hypothetical protein